MLCRTSIRMSFLSKEVSNFNLKPIMETPQRPGLREKMDLLISAADALKFLTCNVVSFGDWPTNTGSTREKWTEHFQTSTNLWVWYFGWPLASGIAVCINPSFWPKSWPGRHLKKRATRELQDVAGYANLDGLGWKGSLERLQQSQKKMQVSFAFISMVHSW